MHAYIYINAHGEKLLVLLRKLERKRTILCYTSTLLAGRTQLSTSMTGFVRVEYWFHSEYSDITSRTGGGWGTTKGIGNPAAAGALSPDDDFCVRTAWPCRELEAPAMASEHAYAYAWRYA